MDAITLPSPWVQRFSPLIPRDGAVLDLACGSGRHSHYLRDQGLDVLAVDRDVDALARLADGGIRTLTLDLEVEPVASFWPFAGQSFAAIVVTNYLHRPLFPVLLDSLQIGGILLYETFAAGNGEFGRPSNPDFLLRDEELLQQMESNPDVKMQVIAYEQGFVTEPKPAMLQRICARRAAASSSADRLDAVVVR